MQKLYNLFQISSVNLGYLQYFVGIQVQVPNGHGLAELFLFNKSVPRKAYELVFLSGYKESLTDAI